MKNRLFLAVLAATFVISVLLTGCGKNTGITTGKAGVVKDEEFGNIYIDGLTIDEFNELGFEFGDSVNVEFDNGQELDDIPYYSGYYVPVGEPLLCGYPGYPHVVIAYNYGDPTWEKFEMADDSNVTVTLNEKGKYIEVQELYSLVYSDERNDYDSDIIFANFREITGGNLKEGAFYRSASPCDNQHNRASYANKLAKENGIRFALNLSDNEEKYTGYTEADDFESDYYDSLYKEGNVLLLAMNANYRSDDFAKIISDGLYEMTNYEGPCLIHCVEGKDRTGFVATLLLALADASAQEIIDDYMITYYNYFGVTKEKEPKRYEAIVGNVNDFLYCLCDAEKGSDISKLDLKEGAKNYLKKGGLSDEQIAEIEDYIS